MSDIEHSSYDFLAPVFRRASYAAKEQTGDTHISSELTARIAHEAGLSIGEAAALAYLARHEVEDIMLEGELEIERLVIGDVV